MGCALLGRNGARFQLGQGRNESMLGTGHNLPQLWIGAWLRGAYE